MNAPAVEPGTVAGKLTIDATDHRLTHVLAWQQPGADGPLWIFLTDAALPLATAQDPAKLAAAVGKGKVHGLRLAIDPADPDSARKVTGTLFLPVPQGYQQMPDFWESEPGEPWATLENGRVAGKLEFGAQAGQFSSGSGEFADTPAWSLEAEFSAPVVDGGAAKSAGTAAARAAAQKSPQADVLLAYEKALLWTGLDAAAPHMTAAKLADMKSMVEQFGADGFRQFQESRRASTPQGEARRQQIETLTVDGNRAVLTARTGPHTLDEVRFTKTKDGWRIDK